MYKVLDEVKTLLDSSTLVVAPFYIKRIEIGTIDEAYNGVISYNDYPAILISPNGEPIVERSFWANHIQKKYDLLIYIFSGSRTPNRVRIETPSPGNDITISQISNELQRVFGTNRKLNGTVRLMSEEFNVKPKKDFDGNWIYEISIRYIDDLIPFDSSANSQNNTEPQTH